MKIILPVSYIQVGYEDDYRPSHTWLFQPYHKLRCCCILAMLQLLIRSDQYSCWCFEMPLKRINLS